jgi:hypothetical protein
MLFNLYIDLVSNQYEIYNFGGHTLYKVCYLSVPVGAPMGYGCLHTFISLQKLKQNQTINTMILK